MEERSSYTIPWIGGSATILRIGRVLGLTTKEVRFLYNDGPWEIWAVVSVSMPYIGCPIPDEEWNDLMIKRLEKRSDIIVEEMGRDSCQLAVRIDDSEPEPAIRQVVDKIAGTLNVSEICPGTHGELE
jgi:hypothetical protein